MWFSCEPTHAHARILASTLAHLHATHTHTQHVKHTHTVTHSHTLISSQSVINGVATKCFCIKPYYAAHYAQICTGVKLYIHPSLSHLAINSQ